MNVIKQNIVIILLVCTSNFICAQKDDVNQLNFLIGTWKMEHKENFESWEKMGDRLKGTSYKIRNGLKKVTETIEIKIEDHQILYTPIVFNQNEGKGIPFQLKLLKDKVYSFENLKHDFPKKIQYKILDKNKLFIMVLGDDDKGFSYHLIKQVHDLD